LSSEIASAVDWAEREPVRTTNIRLAAANSFIRGVSFTAMGIGGKR
jgi:hypothetical protein